MVDRITPATTPELIDEVAERTGIDDRWPVVAEPYTQWVLEDSFSRRLSQLESVGVQVVGDVGPYELMKLRLLNAGTIRPCATSAISWTTGTSTTPRRILWCANSFVNT